MKGTNDFGVGDVGELGALLGEVSDVVSQGLVGLLTAPSEIPRVPRTHVCALEVAHEGSDQVGPIVDLIGGKMFEPRARGIRKVQRKVANDDGVISRAAQLACQAVVVELPLLWYPRGFQSKNFCIVNIYDGLFHVKFWAFFESVR
jgi:hypothetical protein